MSACPNLDTFYAGELSPEEADAVRAHLATCVSCQRELGQLMMEAAVTDVPRVQMAQGTLDITRPRSPASAAPSRRPRQVTRVAAWVVGLAAAAAVLLFLVFRRPAHPELALAPSRAIDVRFTLPAADRYRPYDVSLSASGPSKGERIRLETLAQLESSGDARGLAALLALRGDKDGAFHSLVDVPASGETDSDRAAVYLLQGKPAQALPLAARASAAGVRQGAWNEAVALKMLGLPLAAALRYDRVAQAGEPGWAAEAAARAAEPRAAHSAEAMAAAEAKRIGDAMMDGGPIPPDALITAQPGILRAALYDAVRVASTRPRLEELRALAARLDGENETTLFEYVDRVLASDLTARGQLAEAYRGLRRARGAIDQNQVGPLVAAARALPAKDVLLGVLFWLDVAHRANAAMRAEAHTLALASGDPHEVMLDGERIAMNLLYQDHRPAAVPQEMAPALSLCARKPIAYRCANVESFAARAFVDIGQRTEARLHLTRAVGFAAQTRDPATRARMLYLAGEMALDRTGDQNVDAIALASAYFEEYALLLPGDCRQAIYSHDHLVLALLRAHRLDEAARLLASTKALETGNCADIPPRLNSLDAEAQLLAHEGTPAQVAEVRGRIASPRPDARPGEPAFLDYAEGRLLIEHQTALGQEFLQRAIDNGRDQDDLGQIAASRSESILFLDATRRGDFGAALRLAAQAWKISLPSRCVVALAEEDRAGVVVLGSDGVAYGSYDTIRTAEPRSPEQRISAALVASMASCAEVEVFAFGDEYGASTLLPPTLAWHYRSRHGSGASRVIGPQLVVGDVEPPPELRLDPLPLGPTPSGATVLRGRGATPSEVLAHMADAALIEIHAHGLAEADDETTALALSPDADGGYLLDGEHIRSQPLRRHPVVLLAACGAGRSPGGPWGWGLPEAFLQAGASVVVAAPVAVQNRGTAEVFAEIRRRISEGATPALAVREQRLVRGATLPWVAELVVFQ